MFYEDIARYTIVILLLLLLYLIIQLLVFYFYTRYSWTDETTGKRVDSIGLSGKFMLMLKKNWNAEDLNFSIHLLNYIG